MSNKCHICEKVFPVKSVAMLHCASDKEYDDADDGLWLLIDNDYVKVPI